VVTSGAVFLLRKPKGLKDEDTPGLGVRVVRLVEGSDFFLTSTRAAEEAVCDVVLEVSRPVVEGSREGCC
jgi:hypothetical protein